MQIKDYRSLMDGSRRGIVATSMRLGLWLGSHPYRFGVGLKNRRFASGKSIPAHVGVPVISVGNLTAGGTGKTPMVAAIARHLRDRGLRVALVSRGYASDSTGSNDEALELHETLPDVPHIQNPDRVEACRVAVEELEMQAIVLDDGFQHRRLHRDLDIVLIDATCPFGYGHLLPRGLLREPIAGLLRADVVVISRASAIDHDRLAILAKRLRALAPEAVHVQCDHLPIGLVGEGEVSDSLDSLRNRSVAAFAGIGNPQPFFQSLQTLGANVVATKTFPDHCVYGRGNVDELRSWLDEVSTGCQDLVAICTMKDLVKLRTEQLGGVSLRALRIEMSITSGETEFWRAIEDVSHAKVTSETVG
jgi:tetraacyldisaccharide 4'-kinase